MNCFFVAFLAFAVFALVSSAPTKRPVHEKRIARFSTDKASKKSRAVTWTFKLLRPSFFSGNTAVRDDDDDDFPWVTTIPPLDAVWEKEVSKDKGEDIWGKVPLEIDDDLNDDDDDEGEAPLSTLIPIPGQKKENKHAPSSNHKTGHDLSKETPGNNPEPSYELPIPPGTASPPQKSPSASPTVTTLPVLSPTPITLPAPSTAPTSSPPPSISPSASGSPVPSSTPPTSPTASRSPVSSPIPTKVPGKSLVSPMHPDYSYVVISGQKIDRKRCGEKR